MTGVGVGYTLATGRLFCPMPDFQRFAEQLLGRPVMTHEFVSEELWTEMRDTFERRVASDEGEGPVVECSCPPLSGALILDNGRCSGCGAQVVTAKAASDDQDATKRAGAAVGARVAEQEGRPRPLSGDGKAAPDEGDR